MKLLRLPSGRGVNVEKISSWNTPIKSSLSAGMELDDAVLILFTDEADGAVWFRGPDARALYMWLERNSVAIGEDGREMAVANIDPIDHLAFNWLIHLKRLYPEGMYATPAADDWGIDVDQQLTLAEIGVICSTPTGWVITAQGRSAILERGN